MGRAAAPELELPNGAGGFASEPAIGRRGIGATSGLVEKPIRPVALKCKHMNERSLGVRNLRASA